MAGRIPVGCVARPQRSGPIVLAAIVPPSPFLLPERQSIMNRFQSPGHSDRPIPVVGHSPRQGDVQRCEPRLALSASLPVEWWLDWGGSNSSGDPSAESLGNVIEQSANVAHPIGLDGTGQTAVVIDTGIATDHIALGGQAAFGPGYRVVGGWDFAEDDAFPYDDGPAGFHGTHVASVLGGQTDSFAGVAPGADLISLRVFDDQGASDLAWVESALQWVLENQNEFESPITTVNLSLGAALSETTAEIARATIGDELALLRQDDILVFAASGNFQESTDGVLFPAADDNVVAVSSLDSTGRLSSFAQRAPGIFGAPGESVLGAVPDHVFGLDGHVDDFAPLDGTSLATPQVAGASILIRQALQEAGLPSDADSVLQRLNDSSSLQTDPTTGDTYRPIDLESTLENIAREKLAETGDGPAPDLYVGSGESETLELDLTAPLALTGPDNEYSLAQDSDGVYRIHAGGGNDELTIFGGETTERLILRAGTSQISEVAFGDTRIELLGFEEIVFEGGGGRDRVSLYDSAGDDSLVSRPGSATLSGVGFKFDVEQVPNLFVHSLGGGTDTAYQYDSDGDDVIAVRPEFTSLRSESAFQLAYGFERVVAYASTGNDVAEIYDSAGNDTLHLSAARTVLAGAEYQVTASGFDETIARGGSSGDDSVRVYLDDTDDLRIGGISHGWHGSSVGWEDASGQRREVHGFGERRIYERFEPVDWEAIQQEHLEANRQFFETL